MKTLIRKIVSWAMGADMNQLMLDNQFLREKLSEMEKILDAESHVRSVGLAMVENSIDDLGELASELGSKIQEIDQSFDGHEHEDLDKKFEKFSQEIQDLFDALSAVEKSVKAHAAWIREVSNKELRRAK